MEDVKQETNREDVLLELLKSRTEILSWLPKAAINDNNINGSITKYNMMQKELEKIDKLIETLGK